MKLVTFETNGARHIGAVLSDGKTVADFTAVIARRRISATCWR